MKPELLPDPDWDEYTKPDTLPSCDKGSHRERSLANQPNHIIFWKKRAHEIAENPIEEKPSDIISE